MNGDDVSRAPWTDAEVASLNAYQSDPRNHPFTCGGDRKDARHADGEGVLVATGLGWVCPFCGYRQGWAHRRMADGSWRLAVDFPWLRRGDP